MDAFISNFTAEISCVTISLIIVVLIARGAFALAAPAYVVTRMERILRTRGYNRVQINELLRLDPYLYDSCVAEIISAEKIILNQTKALNITISNRNNIVIGILNKLNPNEF